MDPRVKASIDLLLKQGDTNALLGYLSQLDLGQQTAAVQYLQQQYISTPGGFGEVAGSVAPGGGVVRTGRIVPGLARTAESVGLGEAFERATRRVRAPVGQTAGQAARATELFARQNAKVSQEAGRRALEDAQGAMTAAVQAAAHKGAQSARAAEATSAEAQRIADILARAAKSDVATVAGKISSVAAGAKGKAAPAGKLLTKKNLGIGGLAIAGLFAANKLGGESAADVAAKIAAAEAAKGKLAAGDDTPKTPGDTFTSTYDELIAAGFSPEEATTYARQALLGSLGIKPSGGAGSTQTPEEARLTTLQGDKIARELAQNPNLDVVTDKRTGRSFLIDTQTGEMVADLGQFDFAGIDPAVTAAEDTRQFDVTAGRLQAGQVEDTRQFGVTEGRLNADLDLRDILGRGELDVSNRTVDESIRASMEQERDLRQRQALAEQKYIAEVLRSPSDFLARAFMSRGEKSPLPQITQSDLIRNLNSGTQQTMATGGYTTAGRFVVGDSPSGAPTGNEEMIVNPTGAPVMVIPNRKMPHYGTGTDPSRRIGPMDFGPTGMPGPRPPMDPRVKIFTNRLDQLVKQSTEAQLTRKYARAASYDRAIVRLWNMTGRLLKRDLPKENLQSDLSSIDIHGQRGPKGGTTAEQLQRILDDAEVAPHYASGTFVPRYADGTDAAPAATGWLAALQASIANQGNVGAQTAISNAATSTGAFSGDNSYNTTGLYNDVGRLGFGARVITPPPAPPLPPPIVRPPTPPYRWSGVVAPPYIPPARYSPTQDELLRTAEGAQPPAVRQLLGGTRIAAGRVANTNITPGRLQQLTPDELQALNSMLGLKYNTTLETELSLLRQYGFGQVVSQPRGRFVA